MNRAINLLAALALAELMLTIGSSARLAGVISVARDRSVVIRAALPNCVAVPALAAALL